MSAYILNRTSIKNDPSRYVKIGNLFFLVGRFASLTLVGALIIPDHGVYAQFHNVLVINLEFLYY